MLIAAAALVALVALSVPFPLVVAFAGLVGLALARGGPSPARCRRRMAFPWRSLLVGLLLWLLPAVAVWATLGPHSLHARVLRVFHAGGAADLGRRLRSAGLREPGAGRDLQWVTASQAVAGSPRRDDPRALIIVLQFMGFMAGWNQAGAIDPATSATLAAALASYATFLPSFVFVFVGAPYVSAPQCAPGWRSGRGDRGGGRRDRELAIGFGRAVLLPEGVGHFRWPLAVLALIALAGAHPDAGRLALGHPGRRHRGLAARTVTGA